MILSDFPLRFVRNIFLIERMVNTVERVFMGGNFYLYGRAKCPTI
jgi:hypothetical protein